MLAEHCKDITHLDLGNCPYVTNQTIMRVADLYPNLVHLDISYTNVGDEAVSYLSQRCRKLKDIRLWVTPITDDSLWALIHGCPEIQKIDVRNTNTNSHEWKHKCPHVQFLFS